MAKRNFDSHVIIDRIQNKNYARNAYQMNVDGSAIIYNPQTSDNTSSRFTTFVSGAQTEYSKGLTDAPPTINLGGIFGIPSANRPTVPSAPGIKEVIPGDRQLLVYFYPPMDGGTSITGYEYSLDGSSFIFTRNTVSPMTINGLTNGQSYEIVIRAVNIVGHGPSSEPVEGIPVTVPSAPIITVTPGDKQLTVDFIPPFTGGSSIIGYQYSVYNGGTFSPPVPAPEPPENNQILITGLTNGITYQVLIRAVNSVGNGYPSNMVVATPVTVPSNPIITGITPSNEQLTVYFTLPSDGGSPVTSYQCIVTLVPPVEGWYIIQSGTTSPITITGLTNGITYSIVVQAINRIGEGSSIPANGTPATVPGAPQITEITRGNGQLTVIFTPPSLTGGSPITGYQYSVNNGLNWVSAGTIVSQDPPTESFTITGLTNGQLYPVVIRAVNIIGAGISSNTESGTPATVPDAPRITRIIPGDQQLTVYFAPSFNGGSPITGYQYSTDNGVNFEPQVDLPLYSPIIISGLTNGTVYQVIIRAVNDVGDGPHSNMVTKYPVTVPGAPTILEIVPISDTLGNIGLLVSFSSPMLDGGSPILDYQYSLDSGYGNSFVSAGLNSPFTIYGLTSDTTYQIAMRASNFVGSGANSNILPGTTTATVPNSPTINGIISGNQQLTVTFTPPLANGGSPITGYQCTATSTGLPIIQLGTTSPIIITGLTNGQLYSVVVQAGNQVGYGSNSNIVEGTPATVPSAPTITGITPGTQELSVAFTPPTSTGGSDIVDYQYSTDNGVTYNFQSVPSTVSPITITGLSDGTPYRVKIRAVNSVIPFGFGAASNMVEGTPGTPFAPTITDITPGNEQLAVTFTAPTGGPTPTGYQYSTDNGGTFLPATGSPFTISGLTNGITYQVVIRAINSNGNGAPSTAVSGTPGTVPGAPVITVTSGNGQLSVAIIPSSTGGSPITSYQCTATSIGSSIIQSGTTSPIVITGLTNGTSYSIVVRAINRFGTGAPSAPASGTPGTVPGTPVILGILSGNGQLSIGFCPPIDGGSPITSYQYSLDSSIPSNWVSVGTTSPIVITGLTNGTTYNTVVLRAFNRFGSSATSAPQSGTPGTPSAPRISGITSGSGQITVAFIPSTLNGGFPITGYQYSINGATFATSVPSPPVNNQIIITGLRNATYQVIIRAVNSKGNGSISNMVEGVSVGIPSAPTITGITPGAKQLSVAFTILSGGSPVLYYQYSLDSSLPSNWVSVGTSNPIIITGLSDDTAYPVTIRAVNNYGIGASSTTVSATTSIIVPSSPFITGITPDNGILSVAFTPSTGGAITGYRYSVGGAFLPPITEPPLNENPITITGLTNGTSYSVVIYAVNSAGNGPISNTVQGIPGAPSAPIITEIIPGNTNLTIDFITPLSTGGSEIVAYQYSVNGGSYDTYPPIPAVLPPPTYSFTVPNLSNGTTYTVAIQAINSLGFVGITSAIVSGIPGTPSAPNIYEILVGNEQLSVLYSLSTSDGGFSITGYIYSTDGGITFPGSIPLPTPSDFYFFIITNLTNGTPYSIVMKAINATGNGISSNIYIESPVSTPSAPTITGGPVGNGIVSGNGQLTVFFTPPSNGGAEIDYYEYSLDGGIGYATLQITDNPFTIYGLTNGGTYQIAIRAHNRTGYGPPSNMEWGYPGKPSAPSITGITPGNEILLVYFTPPISDGGFVITGYGGTAIYGTETLIISTASSSPILITGLTNGIPYSITIHATNSEGITGLPTTAGGTPGTVPGAPTITVAPGDEQLSVIIASSTDSSITSYQCTATSTGSSIIQSGSTSPIIITGLLNGTPYSVIARAINSFGMSAPSAPYPGTPGTVPSAPFITEIAPGNQQLTVSFCPPISDDGSPITSYQYSIGANFISVGTTSPFTIFGLLNGTTYQVVMYAVNLYGNGDYSTPVPGTPVA
jgi:hypothetical protein